MENDFHRREAGPLVGIAGSLCAGPTNAAVRDESLGTNGTTAMMTSVWQLRAATLRTRLSTTLLIWIGASQVRGGKTKMISICRLRHSRAGVEEFANQG